MAEYLRLTKQWRRLPGTNIEVRLRPEWAHESALIPRDHGATTGWDLTPVAQVILARTAGTRRLEARPGPTVDRL